MSLTESIVKSAALEWFGELGYAVGDGPRAWDGMDGVDRMDLGEEE